jgi:predicted outer membrane repeat protein
MIPKNLLARIFSLFFIFILLLGSAPFHQAQALSATWYAKPAATGSGNCSSWANACSLQKALADAPNGTEIWVMQGTHKPTTVTSDRTATFQLKDGVAIYGGFAGTETSRSARNPASRPTILSGDIGVESYKADNSYHVVKGASGATLDGFIITLGCANSTTPPDGYGGGIYNTAASPALSNLIINDNTAFYGGGIYNSASSPVLTNSTLSNNTAVDYGGGMENWNNSSPQVTNVTFSGNTAFEGGGMQNWFSNPTITNATFSGNSATDAGGGIHSWSESVPQVRNTILWGNTAVLAGSGQVYDETPNNTVLSYNVLQGPCPAGAVCSHLVTTDPKLGTLGNNGGYTPTIPLLPGSSALNTADQGLCPAFDQRGVARPQGAGCDIGAYELRLYMVEIPLVYQGSH